MASLSQIWRLVPVPLITNIDQLVRDNQFIDAIRLCDSLDDRDVDKVGINSKIGLGSYPLCAVHALWRKDVHTGPLHCALVGLSNLIECAKHILGIVHSVALTQSNNYSL